MQTLRTTLLSTISAIGLLSSGIDPAAAAAATRSTLCPASKTPEVYDVTCALRDTKPPHTVKLVAAAPGLSFLDEKNDFGSRYTPAQACDRFGCDVANTELGPLIKSGVVDGDKVWFYHELPGRLYRGLPKNVTTPSIPETQMVNWGIKANVFIADYAVPGSGDKWVDGLGFCGYWPEGESTNPDWSCECKMHAFNL